MERVLAEIWKDENGRYRRLCMVDLTNMTEEEIVSFYQLENALGRVVVPKRVKDE